MKAEVLAHFQYVGLTCLAMVFFLSVFLGSIWWILRKESRMVYEALEVLPLEDGVL